MDSDGVNQALRTQHEEGAEGLFIQKSGGGGYLVLLGFWLK